MNKGTSFEYSIQEMQDFMRERMLRELSSDLADLVRQGAMTDLEANEWYNYKADQWSRES